jgi:hypothetical protein
MLEYEQVAVDVGDSAVVIREDSIEVVTATEARLGVSEWRVHAETEWLQVPDRDLVREPLSVLAEDSTLSGVVFEGDVVYATRSVVATEENQHWITKLFQSGTTSSKVARSGYRCSISTQH